MNVTTYVLVTKNSADELTLATCRKSMYDIPVGFEPRYADTLFEFAESRVHCNASDEILLMKGVVNTDDIEKHTNFIDAFKHRLKNECQFEEWEIVRSKQAMSLDGSVYRVKLLRHLRSRHVLGFKRRTSDSMSATG